MRPHEVTAGEQPAPAAADGDVIERQGGKPGKSGYRKTAIVVGALFIAADVAGVLSYRVLAMGFLLAAIPSLMLPEAERRARVSKVRTRRVFGPCWPAVRVVDNDLAIRSETIAWRTLS